MNGSNGTGMGRIDSRRRRRGVIMGLCAVAVGAAGLLGGGQPATAAETDQAVVDKINKYLNGVSTMQGAFVQISPDGAIGEGRYVMRRPGRIRFEYAPPNQTLVIADGFWVAVVDKSDLRAIDRFPLSETPLNLLLKDDVDLGAENAIQLVEQSRGQYRVTAADPSGEAQGSITMVFDANPIQLKQWVITDPQGLTTTVALRTVQEGVAVDMADFNIPDDGVGGSNSNR